MAVAVCGMHYTGAAAGTVVCAAPRDGTGMQIGGVLLPYIAFGLSAVVLVLMRWHLQRASSRFRARLAQRIDAIIESAPAVEPAGPTVPRWDRVRHRARCRPAPAGLRTVPGLSEHASHARAAQLINRDLGSST